MIDRLVRKIRNNRDKIIRTENMFSGRRRGGRGGLRHQRPLRQAGRARGPRRRASRPGSIKLETVWPFPEELIRDLAGRVRALIMPEINGGQMVLELERCAGGRCPGRSWCPMSAGRSSSPRAILDAIEKAMRKETAMTAKKAARTAAAPSPWTTCCGPTGSRTSGAPGCGIGTVFGSRASRPSRNPDCDLDDIAMVSGIGCTGRMAGYVKLDSFHTTHGRAIPFATGLKLARPDTQVLVVSGDGDLFAIGGNHFIHAARRNMDLTVICVNNLNYGMTGGQQAPSTPFGAKTTTSADGSPRSPSTSAPWPPPAGPSTWPAGPPCTSGWLTERHHARPCRRRGFSFVEVLAPCPTSFGRRNRMGSALDLLKFYHDRSVIRNDIDPERRRAGFRQATSSSGKFVDIERPTFMDNYEAAQRGELGDVARAEAQGRAGEAGARVIGHEDST